MSDRSLAHLSFPPLHLSQERELGPYYQDLRPAIQIVQSEFHGPVDSDGIPHVRLGPEQVVEHPVTVAQYALALHSQLQLEGREAQGGQAEPLLQRLADHLVERQEGPSPKAEPVRDGPTEAGVWFLRFDSPKYPWLRAPWASAIVQGMAVSALLRAEEWFGDPRYGAAAAAGYHALHNWEGLHLEAEGDLWYEEYPAHPPLHVLNGHLYAALGVLDMARHSGDLEARARWGRAGETAACYLEAFDVGYWSVYDLGQREPVSRHYHGNIHVPLLRIFGELTHDARFTDAAQRWEGYLHSPVARLRHAVSARLHRWRKIS
ncbi:MAG: D-glucuronyl C5-epimerase family protein [Gemmatimonadota bacterium]